MKTFVLIIVLLLLVGVGLFFVMGAKSKTGAAAGLVAGHLAQCSDKPNCVCSEQATQGEHYIEPLSLAELGISSAQQLTAPVEAAGGQVIAVQDDYLAATFTSGVFGFVDDFEVRLDTENGLLHLRSASRVGRSDLGANRKRVVAIKERLANKP